MENTVTHDFPEVFVQRLASPTEWLFTHWLTSQSGRELQFNGNRTDSQILQPDQIADITEVALTQSMGIYRQMRASYSAHIQGMRSLDITLLCWATFSKGHSLWVWKKVLLATSSRILTFLSYRMRQMTSTSYSCGNAGKKILVKGLANEMWAGEIFPKDEL